VKTAALAVERQLESPMPRIVPFLWYSEKAAEAAAFYASLLPNSRVDSVTDMPADSPSGPAGSVQVVNFTLLEQPIMAMSAGGSEPFNHAISFMIECDDQAELDRLWDALSAGGATEACGWLKDRYGLSWQITPRVLREMMNDPDRSRAKRVAEAMLQMVKLDVAGLKGAYDGASARCRRSRRVRQRTYKRAPFFMIGVGSNSIPEPQASGNAEF
jgi:predicted 3-demethylubiquinone-9 3-methyltransferase (glyoxalase superfamily)